MELEPPRYQSLMEIPVKLRKLEGVPLSLAQIEAIINNADAEQESKAIPFSQALVNAQNSFKEKHVNKRTHWEAA